MGIKLEMVVMFGRGQTEERLVHDFLNLGHLPANYYWTGHDFFVYLTFQIEIIWGTKIAVFLLLLCRPQFLLCNLFYRRISNLTRLRYTFICFVKWLQVCNALSIIYLRPIEALEVKYDCEGSGWYNRLGMVPLTRRKLKSLCPSKLGLFLE